MFRFCYENTFLSLRKHQYQTIGLEEDEKQISGILSEVDIFIQGGTVHYLIPDEIGQDIYARSISLPKVKECRFHRLKNVFLIPKRVTKRYAKTQ